MQNKTNQQNSNKSQGNGGQGGGRRNNRRPNRRKNNNTSSASKNNKENQSRFKSNQQSSEGQSSNSKNRHKNQGRNQQSRTGNGNKKRRRRNTPNLSPEEKIFRKYDHLMEVHAHARKKYFEMYFRADPKQKEKLYGNYSRTLEEVHKFERSLKPEEVDIFRSRYQNQTLDTTYTENHSLSPVGDEVNYSERFPDPHYLQSQKESSYGSDTEESIGTMDDYNKYKGL